MALRRSPGRQPVKKRTGHPDKSVVPAVNFSPLSASRCVEVYDDVDLCPVSVAEQAIRAKNSRQPAQAVLF